MSYSSLHKGGYEYAHSLVGLFFGGYNRQNTSINAMIH